MVDERHFQIWEDAGRLPSAYFLSGRPSRLPQKMEETHATGDTRCREQFWPWLVTEVSSRMTVGMRPSGKDPIGAGGARAPGEHGQDTVGLGRGDASLDLGAWRVQRRRAARGAQEDSAAGENWGASWNQLLEEETQPIKRLINIRVQV